MTTLPYSQGWYAIEGDVDTDAVAQLKKIEPIAKLSLAKIPLVTVQRARRLSSLRVEHLWLGCDVTRRAMRHIVQIPGLRALDVLCIKGPGAMGHFRQAHTLETFRANHDMTEAELLEVTQCAQLNELGAQGAELSSDALAAILALPGLISLDIESTCFDDRMAKTLSRSRTLTSLDIGATRLTGAGLRHLLNMQQLRSLDLWATGITETDLPCLLDLPRLESVSLGNYDGCRQLDPKAVCNFILRSPCLKRVWLDGIQLDAAQKEAVEHKLDALHITSRDSA